MYMEFGNTLQLIVVLRYDPLITGTFLDSALSRLGLNVQERCDMITYWLLQLEAYPFNAIYFVDVQRYAQAAKLTISPAPDVLIRVFMTFRRVTSHEKIA